MRMKVPFGILVVTASLTAFACGSDSPTTPSPSPTPGGGGGDGGGTTVTITISGNAVSPRSVNVPAGGRVNFVNNDTRAHEMASDPHPEHTTCPELNQVGFLNPGQSRSSGTLNTRRTCSYHDHINDSNTALQGTVVIQ